MKTTSLTFWASSLALVGAPGALAKPTATVSSASATTTDDEPKCTASLITTLCDYASPFRAAASSGEEHCWGYCHENQPCDFVIFAAGNPYTGTGTCWVYPGESYDESKGTQEGCSNQYLSVFGKPECEETATPTAPACEATASPSAIAEVCDYPPPDEKCWDDCYASSGASNCLSICAEAESCNYAVFVPRGETNSPYEPGTCWVYPKGKFDESKAGTCSGGAEQYVYENKCPKPKPSKTASSAQTSATSGSDNEESNDGKKSGNDDKSEDNESEEGHADSAQAGDDEGDEEDAALLPVALSLTTFVGMGLAMFL